MASNLPFRCCDCGEDYKSQNKLEQHINVEHLSGWTPYWCLYCKQSGVNLKKATKDALEEHVQKMHSGEDFVFIFKPDEVKEGESRDKLRRSLAIQSPLQSPARINVNPLSPAPTPVSIPSMSSSTPSTSAPFSFTMDSHFQPKQEPMDESEFQQPANSSDFGLHCPSPLSSCKICTQEIHNDRASKSEHVKEHFELQFGMRPTELMLLPDTMKQEFIKLLGDCFPDELNLFMNQPEPAQQQQPIEPKQEPIDKPVMKCSVCSKEYSNTASMQYHEDSQMHWGTLQHLAKKQCTKCHLKFHTNLALHKHGEKMHMDSNKDERKEEPVPPSPIASKGKTVTCWCGKSFTDERYLQLHEDGSQHHPDSAKGLHKCRSCSRKYHFKGSLDKHAATHQSPTKPSPSPTKSSRPKPKPSTPIKGKVQCNLCERIFAHQGCLNNHRKGDNCAGRPNHRCNLCRQDFDDAEALQLHRENANHHDKGPKATKYADPEDSKEAEMPAADPLPESFECPKCQKSFPSERSQRIHSSIHCGKTVYRKRKREAIPKKRKRMALPNSPVDCPDCGKSFNRENVMKMHRTRFCIGKTSIPPIKDATQTTALFDGGFPCGSCGRKFDTYRNMRIHQAHKHKNAPKELRKLKPPSPATTERPPSALATCTLCETVLSPSEIDNHLLRVHIDDFTTFCGVCNEGFQDWKNIAQAQEHIKQKHEGQGNVVDKRSEFGAQMWKKRQEHIAPNEKPKLKLEAVKCDHCRKWFTSKEKLQKHMNMVQKSKSFSARVDIKQKRGGMYLMAKLCSKKSTKLAQKPKKRMSKAKIDKPKNTVAPELQKPSETSVDSATLPPSNSLATLPQDAIHSYESSVDMPTLTSIGYPNLTQIRTVQKTSDGIPSESSADTKIRIRRLSSSSSSSGGSGFEIVKTKPGKKLEQLAIKNEIVDDDTSFDLSNKLVVTSSSSSSSTTSSSTSSSSSSSSANPPASSSSSNSSSSSSSTSS